MLTYRFVTDDPDAVAEGPCDDDWIIQGQPSGPDVLSRHEHTGFVGTFTGDTPYRRDDELHQGHQRPGELLA